MLILVPLKSEETKNVLCLSHEVFKEAGALRAGKLFIEGARWGPTVAYVRELINFQVPLHNLLEGSLIAGIVRSEGNLQ